MAVYETPFPINVSDQILRQFEDSRLAMSAPERHSLSSEYQEALFGGSCGALLTVLIYVLLALFVRISEMPGWLACTPLLTIPSLAGLFGGLGRPHRLRCDDTVTHEQMRAAHRSYVASAEKVLAFNALIDAADRYGRHFGRKPDFDELSIGRMRHHREHCKVLVDHLRHMASIGIRDKQPGALTSHCDHEFVAEASFLR